MEQFKFWNSISIGIPARSLLQVRQTFNCSFKQQSEVPVFDDVQIKHNFLRGVPEKNVLLWDGISSGTLCTFIFRQGLEENWFTFRFCCKSSSRGIQWRYLNGFNNYWFNNNCWLPQWITIIDSFPDSIKINNKGKKWIDKRFKRWNWFYFDINCLSIQLNFSIKLAI